MPQPTRAPDGVAHAQNVCPLCRSAALVFEASGATCRVCGAVLAFDAPSKRARLTHIPELYRDVAPALRGKWMSRSEMFAVVDATYADEDEQAAPEAGADADAASHDDAYADGEYDPGDGDAGMDAAARADRWRRLLPLGALVTLLMTACLCSGVLTLGTGVVVATRREAKPTMDVRALALAATQTALTATLSALNAAPPVSLTVPAPAPMPDETIVTVTETPITQAVTEPSPTPAPTETAAPVAPTPVPTQNPLDSPLPIPEAPQSTATVPPTFTPAGAPGVVLTATPTPTTVPAGAAATPTPTLPNAALQATPSPTATATRTVTPSITPSPTATYQPGGSVLSGPLAIQTVRYLGTGPQYDEYVEIVNTSDQQVSLSGLELRYSIKGKAPNDPPDPFEFPNGAVILGRGVCRVYTFSPPPATGACENFTWNWAAGNLWPDRVNEGTTVRLFNDKDQELARFTY